MHTVEAIMMTIMAISMFVMGMSMLIVHYYLGIALLISTVVMSAVGIGYFSWKTAKCVRGTGCEHCNMNNKNDSCQE
jgi:multisubunit Na+/H+ antiporter MnhC subunit